jgi:16S rRNA (guanine966-N2)-methyltransferase
MRIIGGTFSGHRFHPPQKIPARPTTDIAKEGLFNILQNHFEFDDIKALDLFGGTGSISYELASRGCSDIVTVEIDRQSAMFIEKTATQFNFGIDVVKMDVFKFIASCQEQFNFIFAGPPYPLKTIPDLPNLIFEYQLLKPEGWFVLEHNPQHHFDQHPRFIRSRNYGTTIFSIFG